MSIWDECLKDVEKVDTKQVSQASQVSQQPATIYINKENSVTPALHKTVSSCHTEDKAENTICYVCAGVKFWKRHDWAGWSCGRCHPPVAFDESQIEWRQIKDSTA